MKKKHFITKEYLEEHYTKQKKSTPTIAKELGLNSTTTLKRLLQKYNIPNNKNRIGKPKKDTKKFGEIHKSYLWILQSRAEKLGYDFDIDGEYIWELYLKQNRKCAISGLDIGFPIAWGTKSKTDITASLDRINSSKGYTKDNVQWVHKKINTMKMHMTDIEFIEICKTIYKHNKKLGKIK